MSIHLVTVKIGVVRLAIRVVQTQGLLALQYPGRVRHDTRLVERRLTVQQHYVAVAQVSVHLDNQKNI